RQTARRFPPPARPTRADPRFRMPPSERRPRRAAAGESCRARGCGRVGLDPASERVVGRVFVQLGERWVVEDHLDQGLYGAAQKDQRLAEVDELRRLLADAMAADQATRVAVEDELHQTV